MRAVFSFCAILFAAASLSAGPGMQSALAQASGDDPSVIQPDDPPSGAMPQLPVPPDGDDGSPMVRPAPDAGPGLPPEAFGGDPSAEGEDRGTADEETASPSASTPESLDSLFAELKRAGDQNGSKRIADRIERRWRASGSATVDLLMRRAAMAMGRQNADQALDLLDQTLILDPEYAEAWNRRATVHFAGGEYGKSIADIEQTLSREPRHWGAMMGLALILEETDQDEKALEVYERVLDVYPALRSAQDAVGRLSDELTGPAI